MEILSQCFEDELLPTVSEGFSFSNSSHRGGWDLVYDRKAKKGWVCYAHH
jgi:hypothetical protein